MTQRHYFGTDGVRGRVGQPPITPELILKLGWAAGRTLAANEASKRGDAIAREVVRETALILGTGVANLLNIFNPDIVVLAGGVTQAGDALFQPLRAEVRRRSFKPAVQACKIVPGALLLSAGVVGAIATFKMQKLGEL